MGSYSLLKGITDVSKSTFKSPVSFPNSVINAVKVNYENNKNPNSTKSSGNGLRSSQGIKVSPPIKLEQDSDSSVFSLFPQGYNYTQISANNTNVKTWLKIWEKGIETCGRGPLAENSSSVLGHLQDNCRKYSGGNADSILHDYDRSRDLQSSHNLQAVPSTPAGDYNSLMTISIKIPSLWEPQTQPNLQRRGSAQVDNGVTSHRSEQNFRVSSNDSYHSVLPQPPVHRSRPMPTGEFKDTKEKVKIQNSTNLSGFSRPSELLVRDKTLGTVSPHFPFPPPPPPPRKSSSVATTFNKSAVQSQVNNPVRSPILLISRKASIRDDQFDI